MINRGGRPRVLPSTRRVSVELTDEMCDAIAQLTELTGEARTSVIRRGVALALNDAGLWTPGSEYVIPPIPTNKPKENR